MFSEKRTAEVIRQSLAYGRINHAERLCLAALRSHPRSLRLRRLKCSISLGKTCVGLAARFVAKYVMHSPDAYPAMLSLSEKLQGIGQETQALEWARRSARIKPNDGKTLMRLASSLKSLGRLDEAERILQDVTDQHSERWDSLLLRADCLSAQGRHQEAAACLTEALSIAPDRIEPYLPLCVHFLTDLSYKEAEVCARAIIRLEPDSSLGFVMLAQALNALGNLFEAEESVRHALELEPDDPHAYAVLGSILQVVGQMEDAEHASRKAIELEPAQALAYFNIMTGRKLSDTDASLIQRMLELNNDTELDKNSKSLLNFGLGKAHEDLGHYAEAMRFYNLGNEFAYEEKFGRKQFDLAAHTAMFNKIKSVFTDSPTKTLTLAEGLKPQPIFVVGMIRSGTTLTEQILSNHPLVSGGGEILFWSKKRRDLLAKSSLSSSDIADAQSEYIELLQTVGHGNDHVVDKLPGNYMNIGLIKGALPHAKIIHIKRNPMDTCVSIYATYNPVRVKWGNRKDNIVHNYFHYLELMEHWRKSLPSGSFMEIQYETLTVNTEQVVRSMLEYCELPWSDLCLQPESNRRGVSTPSLWQVRQPIYKTSISRWKKFEPWLGEFAAMARIDA